MSLSDRIPPRDLSFLWVILAVVVLCVSMGSLMMPRLATPRDTPPRARCSNNLRQIGLAITMYCNDNQQQYPSDLGLLILTEELSSEVFVCPSGSEVKAQGELPAMAATLLSGGHCSFVYVGAGMTSSARQDDVVAFELPDNHGQRAGGNVLYSDAHVEFQPFDTLVQLVPELEAGRNPPVIRPLTVKAGKGDIRAEVAAQAGKHQEWDVGGPRCRHLPPLPGRVPTQSD